MRILAVDDDPSILELLTCVLATFGYEDVVTAHSGRDALDILRQPNEAFDCLLLDVQMPQMNGIDLCEEVRNIQGYRFTPIIMVTAMVQKQYIDEAFEVGATDYVTKPFEFADLQQRLQDAYRLAAERRAAIEVLEADIYTRNDSEVSTDFRLSDPLYLGNLNGCIGLAEFENYVIQLSTMHVGSSKIMAIKLPGIESLFEANSPDDFRKILTAAGTAVLSATRDTCNFATYWGNGVFLVNYDTGKGVGPQELEAQLRDRPLDSAIAALCNGKLSYVVGEEVTLMAKTKLEALFLIDKAVELSEMGETPIANVG